MAKDIIVYQAPYGVDNGANVWGDYTALRRTSERDLVLGPKSPVTRRWELIGPGRSLTLSDEQVIQCLHMIFQRVATEIESRENVET